LGNILGGLMNTKPTPQIPSNHGNLNANSSNLGNLNTNNSMANNEIERIQNIEMDGPDRVDNLLNSLTNNNSMSAKKTTK